MSRFAAGSRANKCFLCESVVQTQRQRHDVGHEGVITGRDGFSLRSSIANPQGVAQPPLQSTDPHNIRFNKLSHSAVSNEPKRFFKRFLLFYDCSYN